LPISRPVLELTRFRFRFHETTHFHSLQRLADGCCHPMRKLL
jgi:hypothetical protein